MRTEQEIKEIINYYETPFDEDRLKKDIENPLFNRAECTNYMDRMIIKILTWVLNEDEQI